MIRLIFGMILGILVVVFELQNLETVTYTFLAWSVDAPKAVVVIIVLVAGVLVGWFITGLKRIQKKK